jgi:Tol biopolymer transport system component
MLRPLFTFTLSLLVIFALLMFVAKSIVAPLFPRNPMLAYVSGHEGFFDIYVYDFARRVRMSIASTNEFTQPAWSRDGRLAFISVERFELSLMLWDGETFSEIAPDLEVDGRTLTWSRDGRLAFVTIDPDGTRSIYVWENGTLTQTSPSPAFNLDPHWSIDGQLAFASRGRDNDLYVWDRGALNNLSSNTETTDISPQWSLDGRLAFISSASDGRSNINVWDGSTIINIPRITDIINSNPAWSPDGRLAFSAYHAPGNSEIMIWDGVEITSIAQPSNIANGFPLWSIDGRLAFSSYSNPTPDLYVWENNQYTLVAQNLIAPEAFQWSPDGQLIYTYWDGTSSEIASWNNGIITHLTYTPNADEFAPAMWIP